MYLSRNGQSLFPQWNHPKELHTPYPYTSCRPHIKLKENYSGPIWRGLLNFHRQNIPLFYWEIPASRRSASDSAEHANRVSRHPPDFPAIGPHPVVCCLSVFMSRVTGTPWLSRLVRGRHFVTFYGDVARHTDRGLYRLLIYECEICEVL